MVNFSTLFGEIYLKKKKKLDSSYVVWKLATCPIALFAVERDECNIFPYLSRKLFSSNTTLYWQSNLLLIPKFWPFFLLKYIKNFL